MYTSVQIFRQYDVGILIELQDAQMTVLPRFVEKINQYGDILTVTVITNLCLISKDLRPYLNQHTLILH